MTASAVPVGPGSLTHLWILVVCLSLTGRSTVQASAGDRSMFYRDCFRLCARDNCYDKDETRFYEEQAYAEWLLGWTCRDECRYDCMWDSVADAASWGQTAPKFHGKWPFVRVLGMQEPASALLSVLNGASHIVGFRHFHQATPPTSPLYWVLFLGAGCSVNAWFWSTVFHARDTHVSELLDYFCALSLVLYMLFYLLARLLVGHPWKTRLSAVLLLAVFLHHVFYMSRVNFDYHYNMTVCVTAGVINASGWIMWCIYMYFVKSESYVWKVALLTLVTIALLPLELYDFRPLWWTLDAHSLWHAGTVPLPLLYWGFAMDDCSYLLRKAKDHLH